MICVKNFLKAMDQLEHMTSICAIKLCKVIQKLLTKMYFWYQTDLNVRQNIGTVRDCSAIA